MLDDPSPIDGSLDVVEREALEVDFLREGVLTSCFDIWRDSGVPLIVDSGVFIALVDALKVDLKSSILPLEPGRLAPLDGALSSEL